MSFEPLHSKYLNFNTGSFIEASSSIGPTGLETLTSNQEWLYHNVNSQVLINSPNYSPTYTPQITETDNGVSTYIKAYSPIRLNLNKRGLPQSMFIAFKASILELNASSTGYFTFVFSGNKTNNSTLGWLNLSSSVQASSAGPSDQWQTLLGSFQDSEGFVFSSTSSITSMPISPLQTIQTRTEKTLVVPNSSQPVAFLNLSIFYTQVSSNPSSIGIPFINGVYLREINPYIS